jgi:hypothetical protein
LLALLSKLYAADCLTHLDTEGGHQIEQLRKEMHERFDRLEVQQQEMLKQLARIYQAVHEGTAITGQRISQLQLQFTNYWSLVDQDNRRAALAKVSQAFSQAMLVRTARSSGWQNAYLEKLPIFVTYATQESRQSYFRGATSSVVGQVTSEVSGRKYADQLFGLIPTACALIGEEVVADAPNPFALEVGTEGYLQADLLLADEAPNAERNTTVRALWQDATVCRTAVVSATASRVVKALGASYLQLSGVDVKPSDAGAMTPVGILRALVNRWQAETLKERYTVESLPYEFYLPPRPEVLYGFFEALRVTKSSLYNAVDLGLIQLNVISDETKFFVVTWSQTSNATDMRTMYPYAHHNTIPAAFIR